MTSGSRRATVAGLLLLLVVATVGPARGEEPGWTLASLMAERSLVTSASARFVERKWIALLTQPLESSGTLRYVAPDRLEKHTLAPRPETTVLAEGVLSGQMGSGRQYRLVLRERPEVATLIEAIRATLAGDLPTLQRYYDIEFSGARERWALSLTPRNPRVREKVRHIRIEGAASDLASIAVDERDGDHSQMLITPEPP